MLINNFYELQNCAALHIWCSLSLRPIKLNFLHNPITDTNNNILYSIYFPYSRLIWNLFPICVKRESQAHPSNVPADAHTGWDVWEQSWCALAICCLCQIAARTAANTQLRRAQKQHRALKKLSWPNCFRWMIFPQVQCSSLRKYISRQRTCTRERNPTHNMNAWWRCCWCILCANYHRSALKW